MTCPEARVRRAAQPPADCGRARVCDGATRCRSPWSASLWRHRQDPPAEREPPGAHVACKHCAGCEGLRRCTKTSPYDWQRCLTLLEVLGILAASALHGLASTEDTKARKHAGTVGMQEPMGDVHETGTHDRKAFAVHSRSQQLDKTHCAAGCRICALSKPTTAETSSQKAHIAISRRVRLYLVTRSAPPPPQRSMVRIQGGPLSCGVGCGVPLPLWGGCGVWGLGVLL